MWLLVALTATDEITISLLLEKTSVRFISNNKSIITLKNNRMTELFNYSCECDSKRDPPQI